MAKTIISNCDWTKEKSFTNKRKAKKYLCKTFKESGIVPRVTFIHWRSRLSLPCEFNLLIKQATMPYYQYKKIENKL